MSYRVFKAYVYDKTDDELIEELNSIRKDYIEFAKKAVKRDPKWFIDFGDYMYKRWAKRSDRLLDKAIRVIEKGMYDMQSGNPADFSGDCVVVRHQKKIVLWFFPGYQFEDFMKQNEIIKRLKKNDFSYMDSADYEFDSKQEEKDWNKRGKFWDSVFDKYKTGIASNIGLKYEFFRHDDIWDVAWDLYQEYEKTVKKEKKKETK